MGKCKLYIRTGVNDFYVGEFKNRKAAEKNWVNQQGLYQQIYPSVIPMRPIYVEQGKEKGK